MLAADRLSLCFSCHGASGRRADSATGNPDVETAFSKRSRHPVFSTSHFHRDNEIFPERRASELRHVTCADCHEVHWLTARDPFGYTSGYTSERVVVKRATNEFEVCYKCHSESANMPLNQKDKRREFSADNPSFHPVEAIGVNRNVPSLIPPLSFASIIRCGSCHGNDDPRGARGPHGATYEPILSANYNTSDGPENPLAYDLCYKCHNRDSILADASFKAHRSHIVFAETSCHTCHSSHGSEQYSKLISFNPAVVTADPAGQIVFEDRFGGKPRCFLSCHGRVHDDAFFDSVGW